MDDITISRDFDRNGGANHVADWSPLLFRQTIIILSLVGVILSASLAIGFAIMKGDTNQGIRYVAPASRAQEQQHLLETAGRVVTACSEHSLNVDRSGCQRLCHSKLCCFDSGEYSCETDESKNCAAYAGCLALEGIPLVDGEDGN